MKIELLDKEVLAMYDVRGIQAYIFKSNKAKEIKVPPDKKTSWGKRETV